MVYAFPVLRSEQRGKAMIADHLRDVAALAEPFPATVSFAHFIKRDLAAAIEAGRCTVTMPHPMFTTMPGIPVVDVTRAGDNIGYFVTSADGSRWTRYHKGSLTVTWHDFGDTWKKLSSAMRRGLRYLAGDAAKGQHKPRRSTLKALESRGHTSGGIITTVALALYRQHRKEFADVR